MKETRKTTKRLILRPQLHRDRFLLDWQRMRKDRYKAYREIRKLKEQVSKQQTLLERYKKRLCRKSKKESNKDSPRTKTRAMLQGPKVSSETRKILLFHNVLLTGLKKKYKMMKTEKCKQILSKAFTNSLLKKYRMQQMARKYFEMTQRRLKQAINHDLQYSRKTRRAPQLQGLKEKIESFICREDNSSIKAGKKATKTKKKEKRQIYLLKDTLKILHLKYLAENVQSKISYSLFCRLKPFFVIQPRESDRETCLCKRHENLTFKASKLKELNIIYSADLDELSSKITCGKEQKACMYRECPHCLEMNVPTGEYEAGRMVAWHEWQTKTVEYQKRDGKDAKTGLKRVSMTVKQLEKGTVQRLVDEFQEYLKKCCKHFYNIKHQFMSIRTLKEKLSKEDVLIHVDFSENYNCKCATEIQSMHFGASQRQITLHTGVMYIKDKAVPFCSISDSLKHGPSAIWAHLLPVLKMVKNDMPSISNLHVLSDGPTTQYRCKENFYLMSNIPFQVGFKRVNWNFTEAGHGKGAPDGIGAVMKREADRGVAHDVDIMDATALYKYLTNRQVSIKLFQITEDEIMKITVQNLDHGRSIRPVHGTMKIHQIFSNKSLEIWFREVMLHH